MFWFKSFRKFFRKIVIFCTFDHWSEILSLSAGRPISQGVCPPLSIHNGGKEEVEQHCPTIPFILLVATFHWRVLPLLMEMLTHSSSSLSTFLSQLVNPAGSLRRVSLRALVTEIAHRSVSSLLSYLGRPAQLERCATHLLCQVGVSLPGLDLSADTCSAAQQECVGQWLLC